jgi:hypothetical protein
LEDLGGVEVTKNSNDDLVKIKLIKPSHFIYFSNQIKISEEQRIPTWEEEILANVIAPFKAKRYSKISYSPMIDFGILNKKYLGSISADFSSNYIEKENKFNGIEKYGGSIKIRVERFSKALSFYAGFGAYKLNTFLPEDEIILQNKELLYFSSTHIELESMFIKFDLGVKVLQKNANYFADIYTKFKITNQLNFSFQLLALFNKNFSLKIANLKNYGHYSAKFGFDTPIAKDMDLNLTFAYDSNKMDGIKGESIIFSIKYKIL